VINSYYKIGAPKSREGSPSIFFTRGTSITINILQLCSISFTNPISHVVPYCNSESNQICLLPADVNDGGARDLSSCWEAWE
jgi:hypothetical protein